MKAVYSTSTIVVAMARVASVAALDRACQQPGDARSVAALEARAAPTTASAWETGAGGVGGLLGLGEASVVLVYFVRDVHRSIRWI